jgi:hypothetical protein
MKKAIFKRFDGSEICHRIEEDPTAYIEQCAQTNHWGKSLRWVRAKIQVPSLADPQIPEDRYPDEVYTPEDVVDTRIDTPPIGDPVNMVQLRATYTVEIVDLDTDPTWLLEQCHKNRKAAYPSLGEFADAFVKLQAGDVTQMNTYVVACNAVKTQYPKP